MTVNAESDHELMRRVARGDETAFAELVGKYKAPVHAFAYRMLNDAGEADDVAQEAFIKLYRTADLYQPRARFTTWLFTIVHHLAMDRLRKRRRQPVVGGPEAEAGLENAPDRRDTPRQALHREEQAAAVRGAIGQLPADQKTALLLSEYEGLSHAEIADVMNCSAKSVESRLYRAREFLRTKLEKWL